MKKDIVFFAEEILGIKVNESQKVILRKLAKKEEYRPTLQHRLLDGKKINLAGIKPELLIIDDCV